MKQIQVLLAHREKRVQNVVYSLLRNFCSEAAIVQCVLVTRMDQLMREATETDFDLIVLSPENLLSSPGRETSSVSAREGISAIRTIKTMRQSRILAFEVSPENEFVAAEAGADTVVATPFNCDEMKSAFARLVTLHDPVDLDIANFHRSPVLSFYQRIKNRISGTVPAEESL